MDAWILGFIVTSALLMGYFLGFMCASYVHTLAMHTGDE